MTTGIIVPFNFVPFNFVLKSSMSWHCFESKRIDMHVSEFLNAKCLLKSRTRDVCGRFVVAVSFADGNVCATMEHATASSASSDAVEVGCRMHCEMMQDGVAELLQFFVTELC